MEESSNFGWVSISSTIRLHPFLVTFIDRSEVAWPDPNLWKCSATIFSLSFRYFGYGTLFYTPFRHILLKKSPEKRILGFLYWHLFFDAFDSSIGGRSRKRRMRRKRRWRYCQLYIHVSLIAYRHHKWLNELNRPWSMRIADDWCPIHGDWMNLSIDNTV